MDNFAELVDVRVKALEKFDEQVMNYPELLSALSTENLANLMYDRERSGLEINGVYLKEMEMRVGNIDVWEKIKTEAVKMSPPSWDESLKRNGFDPEKRLRHQ